MALTPKQIDAFTNEPNPTDDFEFIGFEPSPTVPPDPPATGGATRNVSLSTLKTVIGTGTPGKSAYQVWLDLGHVGDEAVFIASLKGADSDVPGPKGDPGYTPIKDVDYFDGAKGDKGDPGSADNSFAIAMSLVLG